MECPKCLSDQLYPYRYSKDYVIHLAQRLGGRAPFTKVLWIYGNQNIAWDISLGEVKYFNK